MTRWVLLSWLSLWAVPGFAEAAPPPSPLREGVLTWGGDAQGGGPYIFEDPKDPAKLTGYDMALADELARRLGGKAAFFQAGWEGLPQFLNAGQIDVISNGYEWTAERAAQMRASVPYYVYGVRMLVKADEARIHGWEDLAHPPPGRKWRAAVLGDSAGEFYLKRAFPDSVEVTAFDDSTTSMKEVAEGTMDLTVADTPIVQFFAPMFPALKPLGEDAGRGFYVLYTRRENKALGDALDAAILAMRADGSLERIYSPYGLWNPEQARALACLAGKWPGPMEQLAKACVPDADVRAPAAGQEALDSGEEVRGWRVVTRYGPLLAMAAVSTVLLTLLSFPLAVVVGLLLALTRLYGPLWLRPVCMGLVELTRGTPLMLQLLFVYFFALPMLADVLHLNLAVTLPVVGLPLKSVLASVLGLGMNYAACESEIYRAGLQAVPHGQTEAALALGLTRVQTIRRVVLPQGLRLTLAPSVNDLVALFKDTSVCSVIAVTELTKAYSIHSKNNPQAFVEFALLTSVLYLAMSYPLSHLARRLEARLHGESMGGAR